MNIGLILWLMHFGCGTDMVWSNVCDVHVIVCVLMIAGYLYKLYRFFFWSSIHDGFMHCFYVLFLLIQ